VRPHNRYPLGLLIYKTELFIWLVEKCWTNKRNSCHKGKTKRGEGKPFVVTLMGVYQFSRSFAFIGLLMMVEVDCLISGAALSGHRRYQEYQKYSPTARSVICSTCVCGGVDRAYSTAWATSSACRMTSPSLTFVSSGTISVATQPGWMLCGKGGEFQDLNILL